MVGEALGPLPPGGRLVCPGAGSQHAVACPGPDCHRADGEPPPSPGRIASRLGRPRLAAWHDPRRLVSPAYAPNTKRNEGLGRWARREVTPHQQRTTLATLREDIQEHVETLRQQPNLVLRQLGSLCVAQTSEDQALVCAA